LTLKELSFADDAAGPGDWRYAGSLTVRDGRLGVGLSLTELTGELTASGVVGAGGQGLSIDGELALDRANVGGRVVTDLQGRLVKAQHSRLIELSNTSGQAYGGTVGGMARVDFAQTGANYGFSMVVRDVELSGLLGRGASAAGQGAGSTGPGAEGAPAVVTGNVFCSGLAGSPTERRGGGEVRISQAAVGDLPLLAGALAAANLDKPAGEGLRDVYAKFFIESQSVWFEQIDLAAGGVTLAGKGMMQIPNQLLDVTIVAARPTGVSQLPVLSELVEGAVRELVEVKISGTPARPVFEARPLRSVRAAWQTLFGRGD
jgi:hypothetical protein